MSYGDILTEYIESGIVGRMIEQGYALFPAKSAGYEGYRGGDYYVDMSIRTHVLNGLFPITRLLSYFVDQDIFTMSEAYFRQLLAYFTTHDFHKDPDVVNLKQRGEFDVPLAEVKEEILALSIPNFVTTTPAEHRVTMVHLPSPKVGDYTEARSGTSRLEPWVHIADALSSMQTARDYHTVENYLRKTLTRQYARRPWAFYWHEVDDYRGLSTLLLHQAISDILEKEYDLVPLLYFPNGMLYIGPTRNDFGDVTGLRQQIGETFFKLIQESLADRALDVAMAAIRAPQGTTKFATDAFIFAGIKQLVQALRNETHRKKAKRLLTERFGKRLDGQAQRAGRIATDDDIQQFIANFCDTYQISISAEQDEDFSTKWAAASSFVMGVDSIATALLGTQADEWLYDHFQTPRAVAQAITANKKDLIFGGIADHAIIIAYHYLATACFGSDQRPADAADIDVIFADLQEHATAALQPYDSSAKRLAYVNAEFGLETDINHYLDENLVFSFAPERVTNNSPLVLAARERSYSHGRACSFCNRQIPTEMKSKNRQITMAGIVTTTFSNRLRPRDDRQAPMQVWCPMCYLEFMLRERMGLGYPRGFSTADSDRLYLFLLPDYSFTPEFWQYANSRLLKPFSQVTRLKVRRGFREEADAPTIPNTWLVHGTVNDLWLERVLQLFEKAAEELAVINEKTGRAYRDSLGEKMKIVPIRSPNFQMLTYENSVSGKDKRLTPTRSEMWAKAAYAATLIHLLLGVRIYITDKPYLPLSRPDEMKHIIEMDGSHPLLRHVLPRQRGAGVPRGGAIALADLKEAIDLLSAVWEVNAALSGGQGNRDKQVATVLERVNVEPLAGAGFYKQWQAGSHEVYPALLRACELLLHLRGGDKLNLAQKLTDASLKLFSPDRYPQKGRAHRYETMFRTSIEAVKASPRRISDEELQARVAGRLLKRLPRISGGYIPLTGDHQAEAAADFAELVVVDLFRKRCRGSSAQLTHEENALADAIYYLTDRHISERIYQSKSQTSTNKEQEE
jgi:CRISPR-associated protein Csc3